MTDEEVQAMRRKNDYLKRRHAHLRDNVTSLGALPPPVSQDF